jgi:hypothetical protein
MELPPPSPSQAPSFSQPTLEADDFVRWGKDLRSNSAGSGVFGISSGYSSVHGESDLSVSWVLDNDLRSQSLEHHLQTRRCFRRTYHLNQKIHILH